MNVTTAQCTDQRFLIGKEGHGSVVPIVDLSLMCVTCHQFGDPGMRIWVSSKVAHSDFVVLVAFHIKYTRTARELKVRSNHMIQIS